MRQALLRALGIWVATLPFSAGGCNQTQPPTLSPRSIQVVSVSPTGVTLGLELDVHNPNSFPLVARSVDGTLGLGQGIAQARVHSELGINLPAKASSIVSSTLNIGFPSLSALAPFALTGQPLPYTFHGTALVGGEHLNVSLPFTTQGSLTNAQLLEAGVRGLTP
jgi:LEA14-like dessication related protein